MNHLVSATCVLSALVLVPTLGAQAKYLYSPAGAATQGGGSNNTIPWWGQSATYQQIHDYAEMLRVAGGRPIPIIMKGLGFRPSGTSTLTGRTWELRLAVGQCPNNADNASGTFATNLPKPTVVFATSTTFSKFSFQTVKGTGNPNKIAFTIPFKSQYIYIPLKGSHFCWEWRHRNASINNTMACDAIAGRLGRGTIMASIGSGCGGAKSTVRINYRSPNYYYDSTLNNAATGARAMAMVGIVKQQTPLPGWCSNLETIPVFHIFGTTNAAGSMTVSGALALLKGVPQLHIYTQYAFVDKSKPFGVGLSDTSVYRTNLPGGWQMSRIYKAAFGGTTNGDELATSGSVGKNYGLVVGFLQ